MRRYGVDKPYEKLKAGNRGQKGKREIMLQVIDTLDIPEEGKEALRKLTPANYIGRAVEFAKEI